MPEQQIFFKKEHFHSLIQQLRFSLAKVILKSLIQLYPNKALYYEFMLIIASMEHNPEEFFEIHKAICDKFPGTALEYLANGLYPGVKINHAKAFLHAATRLDPNNAYLYYFLSSTYINLNDFTQSLEYANECMKVDPSFHLALLLKMTCHQKMGNIDDLLSDSLSALCYIERLNGLHIVDTIIHELNKNNSTNKNLIEPPLGTEPKTPTY